jgi:hypothetical protein
MIADCFISYSSADRRWAEVLARALIASGLSAWRDQRMQAGQDFSAEIGNYLQSAKAIVVIWSTSPWASKWVQAEAMDGFRRGNLIGVRVDDVYVGYPFGAKNGRQWLD